MVFAEKVKAITVGILGDRNPQPLQLPIICHVFKPSSPHFTFLIEKDMRFWFQNEMLHWLGMFFPWRKCTETKIVRTSLIAWLCLATALCQDLLVLGLQERTWKGPWEASVKQLPPGRSRCTPLHPLSMIQLWLVTGQVTMMCDAGSLLKAWQLLYLSLGKHAAISVFSRCERSLFCESLRGEHGNTNITSSENWVGFVFLVRCQEIALKMHCSEASQQVLTIPSPGKITAVNSSGWRSRELLWSCLGSRGTSRRGLREESEGQCWGSSRDEHRSTGSRFDSAHYVGWHM